MAEPERPEVTMWWRVAYWIIKLTSAQAHARPRAIIPPTPTQKYVILVAFPLQQWLCERSSMLRYAYIA